MQKYKLVAGIAGLTLLISLLLTSVDMICFNRGFFRWQYGLNHTAENIHISEQGLLHVTDTLLDYLQDKRSDIIVVEKVNGIEREIFDERETLHMVDVKNLYLNAMVVRNVLLFGSISVLLILSILPKNQIYHVLSAAFYTGLTMMGALLLMIGIWAVVDFHSFWMNFHYVFFDNDLFLLDPNISIMINMFPADFFFSMIMAIMIVFVLFVLLLRLLLSAVHKMQKGLI